MLLKKILFFLFIISFFSLSCQKYSRGGLTNSEQIITAYAAEFLNEKNEFVYFKSKGNIERFKNFIGSPVTVKRIIEITESIPGIQLDSLLTVNDVKEWTKKINNYESIHWNQKNLSDIPFIKESEIPDFFYEGGIPQENEQIVTIHFLSTPIIHEDVALLYYSVRASPLNWSSGYYIYAKINNKWKIVASDIIVWGG